MSIAKKNINFLSNLTILQDLSKNQLQNSKSMMAADIFNIIDNQNRVYNIQLLKKFVKLTMELILQRFYLKVLQKHSLKIKKQEKLDQFFKNGATREQNSKLNISQQFEKTHRDMIIRQQTCLKQDFIETFQSFGNFSPEKTLDITFSPNSRLSRTKSLDFASNSCKKLILYAFLVNYSLEKNNGYSMNHSKKQNKQKSVSMKRVMAAMISAASLLKQHDRKKYLKARFLYEKLMPYINQQRLNNRQQYIKIIIEQFQQGYIQSVFLQLEQKNNKVDFFKSSDLLSTNANYGQYEFDSTKNRWKILQPVLNILEICLFIKNKEYGCYENSLHIQLKEMDNQKGFKLLTMTNEDKFSFSDNLFLISTQNIQ